ncbi:MAG: phosphatase PAP2 family protein [Gemmatimonadales bacterium]
MRSLPLAASLIVALALGAGLLAIPSVRHAIFDLDLTVRNVQIAHHVAADNPLVIGLRSYGEGVVYVPVALAFLITGWIRKNRWLVRRGWRLAAGLLLAGVLVWSFKLPAGRSRPREIVGPAVFKPFSGAASFPSGHTASAAVLSANLAEWVPWAPAKAGFAVIAMGTAWARIDEDKHWFSDVVAGALLGMLAWAVVRRVADGPTD